LGTNSPGLVFEVPVDPLTATFAPVVPWFRTTSVDQVALHFSRPVTRFDNFDIGLTRNGQGVPQSEFPITVSGSGSDYTISGLTAATTPEGVYLITLKNVTGIPAGALPYRGTTSVGFCCSCMLSTRCCPSVVFANGTHSSATRRRMMRGSVAASTCCRSRMHAGN